MPAAGTVFFLLPGEHSFLLPLHSHIASPRRGTVFPTPLPRRHTIHVASGRVLLLRREAFALTRRRNFMSDSDHSRAFAMEVASAHLAVVVRSVLVLKIDGFSMIVESMCSDDCFKYRWIVDGYEWEFRVYPTSWNDYSGLAGFVAARLILLSQVREFNVSTILRCCLVDPTGVLKPSKEDLRSIKFWKPQDSSPEVDLMRTAALESSGYVKGDSFNVQVILVVFKEVPDIVAVLPKQLHLPSSNLHQHFAQLLQSETGADVTFLVSGESFAAHKPILAARSPVFMAEFFGDMNEKCSPSVEIQDMEASVFKALLHFIYTDTVPEFGQQEAADSESIYTNTVPEFGQQVTVMAQHLLAAADRYGLDRLKVICIVELSGGISVDTVATTLALAEQHNCEELKERCVEFIIKTSATLDAVLMTEGYKHLEASCPLVAIDIFKAARERRR